MAFPRNILLGITVVAAFCKAAANAYVPLVRDDVTWTFTQVVGEGASRQTQVFTLSLDGDTCVNQLVYLKCLRCRIDRPSQPQLVAMLRESEKRVYLLRTGETDETLIYDFSDWDNISLPYPADAPQLRSIYEIEVGGIMRYCYIFDDESYIIEGIGIDSTIFGLLNPFTPSTSVPPVIYSLVSVDENGTVIYRGKNYAMSAIEHISARQVASNTPVVNTIYYNLQGIASAVPWQGINIVVATHADGYRETNKQIFNK